MSGLFNRMLDAVGLDPKRHRPDLILALAFAGLAAVGSFAGAHSIDDRFYAGPTMDTWFEGDIPRVVGNMTDRYANNARARVHPLFAAIGRAPVQALEVAGLSPPSAIRLSLVGVAVVWVVLFFSLLRSMGCSRLDASIFTLLAGCSASAMFWLVVPETYAMGSVSIILALLLVGWTRSHRYREWVDVGASAFSLSITVTNWMFGVMATLARRPWRRAVQISVNAFALVVVLWGIQKRLFPASAFFIGNPPESGHIFDVSALGFWHTTGSFLYHSLVMPAIHLVDRPGAGDWPIMLTQPADPGSGSWFGLAAVVAWTFLLAAGAWGAVRSWRTHRTVAVLCVGIVLQFGLHTAFGDETFLYSLNFLPLLVALAALGPRGARREVITSLAAVTVILTTANNVTQFRRAANVLSSHEPLHHDAAEDYRRRLGVDPMPDARTAGTGPWYQAGYEAGGGLGFSLGSFSVGFWVVDPATGKTTLSHELPVLIDEELPARFDLPGRHVVTPAYDAVWNYTAERRWELDLSVPDSAGAELFLVLRSIGPRVFPVRDLSWAAPVLTVNDRWKIEVSPVAAVTLTDEHRPDWTTDRSQGTALTSPNGWGVARFGPLAPGQWSFTFYDPRPRESRDRFLEIVD